MHWTRIDSLLTPPPPRGGGVSPGPSVARGTRRGRARAAGVGVVLWSLSAACAGTAHPGAGAQVAADASDGAGGELRADARLDAAGGDGGVLGDGAARGGSACHGSTGALYDPLGTHAAREPEVFPDDLLTVDDPDSPTGLRLAYTADHAAWAGAVPASLQRTAAQMGRVSGFGRATDVLLRFDAPFGEVPEDAAASLQDPGLRLVDLSPGPTFGQRVAFHAELADLGRDLYVLPLRPLRAGGRYGLVVTTAHRPAVGPCIRPAALTRALLTGAAVAAPLERLRGRYQALLDATGLAPHEVSAATVFTVADDLPVMRAVARDVAGRSYAWETPPTCEPAPSEPGDTAEAAGAGCSRVCQGAFLAYDYRSEGSGESAAITDALPRAVPWRLPVTIWLPAPVPDGAPAPVLLFGHGLDKDRGDGVRTAREVCGLGVAVMAADAVGLGEHPAADPAAGKAARIAAFLGASLSPPDLDVFALRGHFTQSAVDRLQLLALIRQHPDVDGDGLADLDPGRVFYRGISLGAMMGAATMALDRRIQAGVLTVVGGRLLGLVTQHPALGGFAAVWRSLFGSEAAFHRWLTVVQPAVDLADPAVWADQLLGDVEGPGGRAAEGAPAGAPSAAAGSVVPDLLVQLALTDEIVIPRAGRAFALALGVPVVGTVGDPLDGLPYAPGLPVAGNWRDGLTTAAVFQYDRITAAEGVVAVRHRTLGGSPEDAVQLGAFLGAWLSTGRAEVVDPYAVLGTPLLAAAPEPR